MQLWILPAEFPDGPREQPDLVGFGQTQIDIAAGDVIECDELLCDFIGHADQIFCAVAQQHAFIGQTNAETAARKQFFPQFILQGPECF